MQFKITKTAGQKLVIDADSIEIERGTGKLILWNDLQGGEIVAHFPADEWRGIERITAAPIPNCNCGG